MVGPHKKGSGSFSHLLVAVDKFTKWIEAKPITNIHSEEAVKFFLDIIYRFGVPNYIITDVDRISSAVLRGVSHEGRLIGRGA